MRPSVFLLAFAVVFMGIAWVNILAPVEKVYLGFSKCSLCVNATQNYPCACIDQIDEKRDIIIPLSLQLFSSIAGIVLIILSLYIKKYEN